MKGQKEITIHIPHCVPASSELTYPQPDPYLEVAKLFADDIGQGAGQDSANAIQKNSANTKFTEYKIQC